MAKRRFIDIGTLGFLHGILHIYQSALPPIYLLLQQEFNISSLQLGLIGSINSITNVFQSVSGFLSTRIGRKRIVLIGMLLYTVAVFAFGLSPSFLVLLVFVALAGFGGSSFHPATYSMVSERSPKEHITKSMAYHQFGGFIGGAIGVALVGTLASLLGWRSAVQVLIVPGLIAIGLFWFIVQEGNGSQASTTQTRTPETRSTDDFRITMPLLIVLLQTFIGPLGGGLGRFLPMFLGLVYGESIAWAGILTGIMQGVGCVSLMIGGVVADRYDKVWVISSFTFLTGLSTIVLARGHFTSVVLLLVLVFRGFVQYFGGPARHAIVSVITKSSPKGFGLEFGASALGGIISAPLTGYLIDTIGIRSAFLVLSIFTFLSSATILLLKKYSSTYTTPSEPDRSH